MVIQLFLGLQDPRVKKNWRYVCTYISHACDLLVIRLRRVTSKLRLACDLLVICLWFAYDASQASHKRVTSVSPKLRYLPSRLNWTCRQQRGLLAPPLLLAPLSLFTWHQPICTKLGNDGSWSLNFTSMGGVKTEPKTGFLVFLFFTCLDLHVLLISYLDWKALRRKRASERE